MKCAIQSCNRPSLDGPQAQGCCILHAKIPDKDLEGFQTAIDEIIEKADKKDKECDFSYCYFPEGYDCERLRKALERTCLFLGATFLGYAYFVAKTFSGVTTFQGATFSKEADFNESTFKQSALFQDATFSDRVYFGEARFLEEGRFQTVKFLNGASFYDVAFSKEAYFDDASFAKEVRFDGSTFSGGAFFRRANFSGMAGFRGITLKEGANLSHANSEKAETVVFQDVTILNPELVKLHHINLSRWSFLDTDLRLIDFDDVTWEKTKRPAWLLGSRSALYDELHNDDLHQSKDRERKGVATAKVERLYRHLKQNYENQRDYSRASDFYYGEMVMKRRQLSWPQQIPFWIYHFLSCYGESYGQAFLVLVGMILLFGALFMFAGFTDNGLQIFVHRTLTWEPSAWWETLKDFAKSLVYSAESMTLFHQPNITFASFWGKGAELAASVLGILQIALFGLALKRRFKR